MEPHEGPTRELAPVLRTHGENAVREVWGDAVETAEGRPTAADVREAAAKRRLPGPKTAEKQARESGEAVLGSDGYWHTGNDPGDMRYGNVVYWASMLEREPFPDPGDLEVPWWMQEKFEKAVRDVHGVLTDLLENGWKEHPSDPR